MLKIHHVCIQTNDYQKSLDFYCSVLNFEVLCETPDFHERDYNTWLGLNGFMIELQTSKGKNKLKKLDSNSCGLVHFCLYTNNIDEEFQRLLASEKCCFKEKKGEKLYSVGKNKIMKIIAPEGTIIEIRDSLNP